MTIGERTKILDRFAAVIEKVLSDIYGVKLGFALFMFPFEGEGKGGDYISNAKRDDMIKFIRETADRLEKGEDIGRPIGEA